MEKKERSRPVDLGKKTAASNEIYGKWKENKRVFVRGGIPVEGGR